MYHDVKEFLQQYGWESDTTARVFAALTDESLSHSKAPGHPTLGDIAWHIATAPSYMLNQTGYSMTPYEFNTPADLSAKKIQDTYADTVSAVKEQSAGKSAEDLQTVFNVFGTYDWPLAMMLSALCSHEIHHRGQVSVLMRQAGLVVPSIYGPNYEETQQWIANAAAQGAEQA
jgi:uncharacterized damage-inducible protein DinB